MTIQSTSILKTLVLAALLVPAATAGAQSKPTSAATTTTAVTNVRPWEKDEYRLGPGDKLRVEVYKDLQLSQSLQVRPDGKITLPLVGDFAAAGKTPIQLRDELTKSLKEYVTNPVVTVIVVEAGAIVERGSHADLLAANGRYRQLHDKQYKFEADRFINPGEDFTPEPDRPATPARVGSAI